MTTEEIVKKIVSYINSGENIKAEEELYSDDVVSFEQNGHFASGKEAVIQKTKDSMANIEEFFGGGVKKALVGKDSFILEIKMDVKFKGMDRMEMKEYGFYKVKDGKISEEYFFSEPMQL